jgi:type III secretory pathway component EscS
MRKIIFGISIIVSIVLVIKIIGILLNDFSRLTEYGFGYLIGLIVLFLILVLISYLTGRKIIKKSP